MLRRTKDTPVTTPPRDVEALERVLAALEGGVRDETDAHRVVVTALVDALGLDHGAVWLPVRGGFTLAHVAGPMASALADTPLTTDGLAGQALLRREPALGRAVSSPCWWTARSSRCTSSTPGPSCRVTRRGGPSGGSLPRPTVAPWWRRSGPRPSTTGPPSPRS